jgi:hypothetical protein
MGFNVADRYKLELHWNKVIYEQDQIALLKDCYFSGPVLKDVTQLNQRDIMNLDFSNQYLVFIDNYYIAKLSWEGVRHTPDKIFLGNAILKNKNLNVVPKLKKNDYIVIDTHGHENEKHNYTLVYPSFLVKDEGQFYDFRGSK